MGDGVAGVSLPAVSRQHEEGCQLACGQGLAVDVGGDERGGEVVGRGVDPVALISLTGRGSGRR